MRISIGDDNVNFKPVEVNNLQDFVKFATKHNYSTGIFKDNYRNKANFIEAECIALDVDNEDPEDNYTIADAKALFADFKHIIMPSKSHQKEKNGRVADRFRVILFLERPITDAKDFTATWGQLLKFYPAADKACKDASRFYYPSPEAYSVNEQGRSWPVTQYVQPEPIVQNEIQSSDNLGQLARSTMNFLIYGAPAGYRNARLFKAAKDMQEQGFSIEECKTRVSQMIASTGNWGTPYLNETDIMTITNAYKETPMYEPREGEPIHKSAFKFETLREMKESAASVEWFVEDLLSVGGFTIFSGEPKIGKSTLLRNLIKETLEGGTFLGRKVKKGRVMLFSFEEQRKILATQLEKCGVNPDNPDLLIHTGDVFGENVFEDLEDAILDFGPTLVILDTVFAMSQIESINSYKETYDALKPLRHLSRISNACFVGVHHNNKSGRFMGSQAIYAVVDTMMSFIKQNDRRYFFSSGKDGVHFDDQELLFNPSTQTYSLGKARDKKKVDLL